MQVEDDGMVGGGGAVYLWKDPCRVLLGYSCMLLPALVLMETALLLRTPLPWWSFGDD